VPLATDAEVLDAYREHFGLRLHRLRTVHQVVIFGRNS
jgi:N-hydroxyarylamine O-acetyltransferase